MILTCTVLFAQEIKRPKIKLPQYGWLEGKYTFTVGTKPKRYSEFRNIPYADKPKRYQVKMLPY